MLTAHLRSAVTSQPCVFALELLGHWRGGSHPLVFCMFTRNTSGKGRCRSCRSERSHRPSSRARYPAPRGLQGPLLQGTSAYCLRWLILYRSWRWEGHAPQLFAWLKAVHTNLARVVIDPNHSKLCLPSAAL